MSNIQNYEALEADYGSDTFRRSVPVKGTKHNTPTRGRRRGKGPQSINGIHRRRRKKIVW
jgi:hypothetical protein